MAWNLNLDLSYLIATVIKKVYFILVRKMHHASKMYIMDMENAFSMRVDQAWLKKRTKTATSKGTWAWATGKNDSLQSRDSNCDCLACQFSVCIDRNTLFFFIVKGQLILKANFLALIWTKKQRKLFFCFLP